MIIRKKLQGWTAVEGHQRKTHGLHEFSKILKKRAGVDSGGADLSFWWLLSEYLKREWIVVVGGRGC